MMSIFVLYPSYTLEQLASSCASHEFGETLAAWSACFHPAIFEKTRVLPQFESAYQPPDSAAVNLLVLPAASEAILTPKWCAQREAAGTKIVRSDQKTRGEISRAIIDALSANEFCEYSDEAISHFFAFGTAFFFIEQLLLPMHCAHLLPREEIAKHLLNALDKCNLEEVSCGENTSEAFFENLRAAYELLIETRTTFCAIPQAKFVDLTFFARGDNLPASFLKNSAAENFAACSLITTPLALESLEKETRQELQKLIAAEKISIACGDDATLPMTLMPLLEIIESLRRGHGKFTTNFASDYSPIFARLSHGISPLLPLLSQLCGYGGVIHWIPQTGWKLTEKNNGVAQWRGVDGSTIPALMRYPIAANTQRSARDFLQSLASLSSSVLPLAICAHQESFLLNDLRCGAEFETFGKFYTLQQICEEAKNSADMPEITYSMAQYRSQFAAVAKENIISDSLQRFSDSVRKIIAAQEKAFADLQSLQDAEPEKNLEVSTSQNARATWKNFFFSRHEKKILPLAEEILRDGKKTFCLRNEFFAVQIDAHTGGIASLMSPQVRGNRLAAHVALRLSSAQRRDDNRAKTDSHFGYTIAAAEEILICDTNAPQDSVRVKGKLLLPNCELAARFEQTFTIARGSKILEAFTTIEPILFPDESLWENYYAIRFAWKNPSLQTYAGIHSGLYLWEDFLDKLDADLIESPEMLELRWRGDRFWNEHLHESLSLFFGGLPFYRRVPPRKLDAILIPHGEIAHNESTRSFRWGIGVDLDAPMQHSINFAAQQKITQQKSAPRIKISPSNVILIDWKRDGEKIGEKIQASLVETAGIETPITWQLPNTITNLRRVNFFGKNFNCEVNSDFPETLIAEKNVLRVTLRPYELILLEWSQA